MKSVNNTAFKCKVCDSELVFNILDETSYQSKTEKKEFFGMQLVTYRVYHDVGSVRHHNAVLADHEGAYRGHVDAYSENVKQTGSITFDDLWLISEEEPLQSHSKFGIVLFFDYNEGWILDIICPFNIKPIEITKTILNKLQEAASIYQRIPNHLSIPLADMVFEVFHSDNQFMIITKNSEVIKYDIQELVKTILAYNFGHRKGLPNSRAFKTCFKLIEVSHPPPELLLRLLTDEILNTPIFVPLANNFPVVMKELQEEFDFPKEMFSHLLLGRTTVLDLLSSPEYLSRADELVSIVDFGKKITEIQYQKGLRSSPEIQTAVRDLLTRFKVVAELEKGVSPKKLADVIFSKEFKSKDPDFVNRMIREILLQTLETEHLREKVQELVNILSDKRLKQVKKVSKAIF